MNRLEIEAEIKRLQDKLDGLPTWPIEEGHPSYYFSKFSDDSIKVSFNKHNTNNALREQDCKKLYQKQLLLKDMMNWVAVHCPDYKPDWDTRSEKVGIILDSNKVLMNYCIFTNSCIYGITVPTEELAQAMLTEFKDRIKEWY